MMQPASDCKFTNIGMATAATKNEPIFFMVPTDEAGLAMVLRFRPAIVLCTST